MNNKSGRLLVISCMFVTSLACNLVENTSPLADENPVGVVTAETETAVVSLSSLTPLATSTPIPPTPTSPSPSSTPTTAIDRQPTPEFPFGDLTPYRQAMLPEFAEDVDSVAAAGASRYSLEVNLSLPTTEELPHPHLNGVEQVQYTNTEAVALSDIYFRLYPNLPGYGGRMTVDQVVVDGQIVESQLEAGGSALRVPLAEPLPPGATIDLTLTYQADIPARGAGYNIFSYTDDTIALAGFYPAIAVYDDEGWNVEVPPPYGDATYLDVSLYQVELTVPQEMVVAASGSLIESRSNSNNTKTVQLASGPMRDFYLALRADYQTTSEIVSETVVTSYYPPDLQAGGLLALRYAADSLRVFNERFGQYPYAEFDIVATPTLAGGVEYPGLVVISQRIYDQAGGFFQHATVHEVAHQWWYGLVGNDQVDEPWLDEALTNYSTILYWEEIEGPEAANGVIENLFVGPYTRAKTQGLDRAVAGPVADFSEGEYGVFVYGKGPLFFNALRQEVGDETFLAIMQAYFTEYKYQIAQPDDLLAIIERISRKEIDSLFEQWIQPSE